MEKLYKVYRYNSDGSSLRPWGYITANNEDQALINYNEKHPKEPNTNFLIFKTPTKAQIKEINEFVEELEYRLTDEYREQTKRRLATYKQYQELANHIEY